MDGVEDVGAGGDGEDDQAAGGDFLADDPQLHGPGLEVPVAVEAADEEVGDPDQGEYEGDLGVLGKVLGGVEGFGKEAALIAEPEDEGEGEVEGGDVGGEDQVLFEFPCQHSDSALPGV